MNGRGAMSISAPAQRGLGSAARLAFGLSASLLVGAAAVGVGIHDACAHEEENAAPSARPISYTSVNADVRLEVAGTYRAGFFNASACESIAYDPKTQRLFVANIATKSVDVVNIGNPFVPTKEFSIDVSALIPPLGSPNAVPTSVAVNHNGFLAVVVAPQEERTLRGIVAFFDPDLTQNDAPINLLPVGYTPAMAIFTPNGRKLLVANEGKPIESYLEDPPGLISVIDLAEGVRRATVRNVDFAEFNDDKDELVAAGVRISGPNFLTPDPNDTATVAQDVELEHIATSADSRTAWIPLPENNALAVLDVSKGKVRDIVPFGVKDHTLLGNGLDPSDADGAIKIGPWPVNGMYMPTQVATYEIGSQTYFVFANSGTHRDYEAFDDRITVKEIKLDEQRFPDAEFLQKPENLGNLRVSNVDGDYDRDGDFDAIFAFGGRSFSILSANGLRYVSDSGDDFEQITALAIPNYFNTADHKNKFESESDAKGPKPLSVTTGKIGEKTYAFIGLKRIGGVMVYDVSDPQSPQFQQYINNRNFAIDPEAPQDPGDPNSPPICVSGEAESERCAAVGDLSAEDLVFIASDQSPVATPLLVVGNQTSGSATIFRISSVEDTASLDQ